MLETMTVETAGSAGVLDSFADESNEELLAPRRAAVELRDDFQFIAWALAPNDVHTQDDLMQEMALAALECQRPHKRSFFLSRAAWRARDWMRWWLAPLTHEQPGKPEARFPGGQNIQAKLESALEALNGKL